MDIVIHDQIIDGRALAFLSNWSGVETATIILLFLLADGPSELSGTEMSSVKSMPLAFVLEVWSEVRLMTVFLICFRLP